MRKLRIMLASLLMAVAVGLAGCGNNHEQEHPTDEHPTQEHPSGEHPQ